jgi:dTMP kinase
MAQSTVSSLRSRFIVLDGPEGSGKSTQVRLLAGAMQEQGLAPLIVRDPGTTRIGEQIRAILLDPAHTEMSMRCEMLLYMAARAQMMAQTIVPALAAGQTVICDRFVSSTLAYQLGGDGLTAEEIRAIADIAIKSGWPDLTIILDIPIAQSFARVRRARDRIEQRPAEYHEQVRRNYLAQAAGDPLRYRVINADRPAEQVHTDIWSAIMKVFG